MTTLPLARSVPLARRQFLARRGRTIAGIVGIAVAFLLVLALKAIFAGMEERLTAFIDATGADVIVAQEGVTTMHMTESALPEERAAEVASVRGVASVDGIVYKAAFVETDTDGKSGNVALVSGGPVPNPVAGRRPGPREVVLDHALADKLGVQAGDRVRVLGTLLRVSGEVNGTASITGSYAFVARRTMERMFGAPTVVSYLLVYAKPGIAAEELSTRINSEISGVTASTRKRFATSERRVVGDMTTDIVRGMILVGFVIGVAVAGLVAYSQTLTQLRDYGVLRALGLSARRALALVIAQVGTLVVVGFLVALGLAALLAAVLPVLSTTLILSIRTGDIAQTAIVAGAVALAAALLPVIRVVRVEPASVFRTTS